MDGDQLHIPRSMSKFPAHAREDIDEKDGLQHDAQQMHPPPQGYAYSVPRSLVLQDYMRLIDLDPRSYSQTANQNRDVARDNYVLGFGTSTYDFRRVGAEPITSRLAALLLEDDDTEVTHLVFEGLRYEDTCAQEPQEDKNATSERKDVLNANTNNVGDMGDIKQHKSVDMPQDKIAHRNLQATVPEANQCVEYNLEKELVAARALAAEDMNICHKSISRNSQSCSGERGNRIVGSSKFSDDISSSSYLLQIGSWVFVARRVNCRDEIPEGDVPVVTLAQTGGYPNQLKYDSFGVTQCAGDAAESSQNIRQFSTVLREDLSPSRVDKGKRRISGSNNEDEDEEQSEDDLGSAKKKRIDYDFACPFYKHQSRISQAYDGKRYKYRVCATTKFANITRLKEHLYRVHKDIRCPRCQKTFKDNGKLENHLIESERCEIRSSEPLRGMTAAEELLVRKKSRVPDQGQKWREIYHIFFPNESVPSPYHHDPAFDTSGTTQQGVGFTTFIESRMPQLLETELRDLMNTSGLDADQRTLLISSIVSKTSSCHMSLWKLFHCPQLLGSPQSSEATGSLQTDSDPFTLPDACPEAAIEDFSTDFNGQQSHQTNALKATTTPTIYGNGVVRAPPIQSQLPPTPNSTGSVTLLPTTYCMPLTAWNSDSGRGTLPSYSCDHGMCIDCQHRKSMDLMMSPTSAPAFLAGQPFLPPSAEPNQGGEPTSWVPGLFDHHTTGENQVAISFEGTRNSQYQDTQDENSLSQLWPNWQ